VTERYHLEIDLKTAKGQILDRQDNDKVIITDSDIKRCQDLVYVMNRRNKEEFML